MNFKEGMRRLALVSGFVGAAAGMLVVYMENDTYRFNEGVYQEYAALVDLPVMQKIVASAKADKIRLPPYTVEFTEEVKPGIKELQLSNKFEIESFTRTDGAKVYQAQPPSYSNHIWTYTFPIIGFLLPWGILRIFSWIVSGFGSVRT
jgi:hypothetical protein